MSLKPVDNHTVLTELRAEHSTLRELDDVPLIHVDNVNEQFTELNIGN